MASKDFKKYAPWAIGLVLLYYFKDVFKTVGQVATKPLQDAANNVQASQYGIPNEFFPIIKSVAEIINNESSKGKFEDSNEDLAVSNLNKLENPVMLSYFETYYTSVYGESPVIAINKFLTPKIDHDEVLKLRKFIKTWLYG